MEDYEQNSLSRDIPLPKARRLEKLIPNPKLKLLDQCREVFR